jgi:ribosome-binding protein aMBF1 (putative translation factor)
MNTSKFVDAYDVLKYMDSKMSAEDKIEANLYSIQGDFSLFLVEYRDKNDLTQKELSDKLKMKVSEIRRYENGASPVSLVTMNKISGMLGYNLMVGFSKR